MPQQKRPNARHDIIPGVLDRQRLRQVHHVQVAVRARAARLLQHPGADVAAVDLARTHLPQVLAYPAGPTARVEDLETGVDVVGAECLEDGLCGDGGGDVVLRVADQVRDVVGRPLVVELLEFGWGRVGVDARAVGLRGRGGDGLGGCGCGRCNGCDWEFR